MKVGILGYTGRLGNYLWNSIPDSIPIHIPRIEINKTIDLSNIQVDTVINCIAYTSVDNAQNDSLICYQINTLFVQLLSLFCLKNNINLIHFTTDYAYTCKIPGVYGHSKLLGERFIQETTSTEEHLESDTYQKNLRLSTIQGHSKDFIHSAINNIKSRKDSIVYNCSCHPSTLKFIYEFISKMLNTPTYIVKNGYCGIPSLGIPFTSRYDFHRYIEYVLFNEGLISMHKPVNIKTIESDIRPQQKLFSCYTDNTLKDYIIEVFNENTNNF